jgi:hypothetical protein
MFDVEPVDLLSTTNVLGSECKQSSEHFYSIVHYDDYKLLLVGEMISGFHSFVELNIFS